jgi:hypothetical protein
MVRYIVIDNYSGYIVGDTANRTDKLYRIDDPIEACNRLSPSPLIRVSRLGPHAAGFRVYRALDQIDTEFDRRNTHVIETIEQECQLAATVLMATG